MPAANRLVQPAETTAPPRGLSRATSAPILHDVIAAHEEALAKLAAVAHFSDSVALGREPTADETRIVEAAGTAEDEALKAVAGFPVRTVVEAAAVAAYLVEKVDAHVDIDDLVPFLKGVAGLASGGSPTLARQRADFEQQIDHLLQMARLHEQIMDELMQARRQDADGFWKVEVPPEERDMIDFSTANLVERARALEEAWLELERAT